MLAPRRKESLRLLRKLCTFSPSAVLQEVCTRATAGDQQQSAPFATQLTEVVLSSLSTEVRTYVHMSCTYVHPVVRLSVFCVCMLVVSTYITYIRILSKPELIFSSFYIIISFPSSCLPVCLSVCGSVCLHTCLYVCLSVSTPQDNIEAQLATLQLVYEVLKKCPECFLEPLVRGGVPAKITSIAHLDAEAQGEQEGTGKVGGITQVQKYYKLINVNVKQRLSILAQCIVLPH